MSLTAPRSDLYLPFMLTLAENMKKKEKKQTDQIRKLVAEWSPLVLLYTSVEC